MQGERVVPRGYFLVSTLLLSDSANWTLLRAVVLTQYRCVTDGQTDGQTDGIAVASTALAMRALRRAVKYVEIVNYGELPLLIYFYVLNINHISILNTFSRPHDTMRTV